MKIVQVLCITNIERQLNTNNFISKNFHQQGLAILLEVSRQMFNVSLFNCT